MVLVIVKVINGNTGYIYLQQDRRGASLVCPRFVCRPASSSLLSYDQYRETLPCLCSTSGKNLGWFVVSFAFFFFFKMEFLEFKNI